MTIQYREKGEASKISRWGSGADKPMDIPERQITPRVAKLLAEFERPKSTEAE